MKTCLLSFVFIFSFLNSYDSITINLDVKAPSNYTDHTNMTYSNCFDFFNGISNQSLPQDSYIVKINSNLSLNGKFSVMNYTIMFM